MRRTKILLSTAIVAVAATACPPDPGPGPAPSWTATRLAYAPGPPADFQLSALTSDEWFASVGSASMFNSSELRIRPRSGPDNSVLGTPVATPLSFQGPAGLIGGGDLIGARGISVGVPGVELFSQSSGAWASLGIVSFPEEDPVAMTDDWIVTRVREGGGPQLGQVTTVNVYSLDVTGPFPTATLTQTLTANPAWHEDLQPFFGTTIAIDGDVLVIGTVQQQSDADGYAPGVANVYRQAGGTWTEVAELGGEPGGPLAFGTAVTVDDGASVDRVAVSHSTATAVLDPKVPRIEVYADAGAGFAAEQTIGPLPVLEPGVGPFEAITSVSLDGDLLATAGRNIAVASSDPGAADGQGGYVQLFRRGATTWAPEAEVATFEDPLPTGVTSMRPTTVQVSGNHVAVVTIVGFPRRKDARGRSCVSRSASRPGRSIGSAEFRSGRPTTTDRLREWRKPRLGRGFLMCTPNGI